MIPTPANFRHAFALAALVAVPAWAPMRLTQLVAQNGAQGHWQGQVRTGAGEMAFTADLSVSNGQWTGTIDVPALGFSASPFALVRVTGDSVHIELSLDDATVRFDGSVSGETMGGTVLTAQASYAFAARRVPRPDLTYSQQDVTIPSGDARLAATLYLPRSGAPAACVVFAAGLTPRSASERFLAVQLVEHGIAVLTYDRRGLGQSSGNARSSFSQLADDIVSVVRYARSRPEMDTARIGLRGQSQGAWLVELAATRVPVSFVIATGAGGVQPWQSELYAIPARMNHDGFPAADTAAAREYMQLMFDVARSGEGWERLESLIGRLRAGNARWLGVYGYVPRSFADLQETWRNDFSFDPAPVLRRLTAPLLVLEGELDVYSPPQANADAVRQAVSAGLDVTVAIVPRASHDFRETRSGIPLVSQPYLDLLLRWTIQHTGGATAGNATAPTTKCRAEARVLRCATIPLSVTVSAALRYVGSLVIPVGSTAVAERYVYAAADATGRVESMFVLQLEERLSADNGQYNIRMTTPVTLDGRQYQRDLGVYDFAASSAARPGAEADQTQRYLEARSLNVDGQFLVARYARVADAHSRSEVILFYWERPEELGVSSSDLQDATRRSAALQRITERSLAAIALAAEPR
jgi:pimeloyl-ACP methyl ester carboxylesterase